MTKKKRRELEEKQRKADEERMEIARRQAQDEAVYPGIAFGPVGGCVLPVTSGKVTAVQLPPIIQPIAMVPFASPYEKGGAKNDANAADDGFDDDFDDWL